MLMFVVEEVCEEVTEPDELENNTEQTEFSEAWEKDAEEQQEMQATQELQQTYEEQGTSVQKRQSSFCLNMEFGKCGGKISCKGESKSWRDLDLIFEQIKTLCSQTNGTDGNRAAQKIHDVNSVFISIHISLG